MAVGTGLLADIALVGNAELDAALSALGSPAEIAKAARQALRKGATLVAREQRKRAPKKSGELRKAIKVATKANWGRATRQLRMIAERNGEIQLFIGIDASVDRGRRAKQPRIARGKNKGKWRPRRTVNSVAFRAGVLEHGSATVAAAGFMRGGYQAAKSAAKAAIAGDLKNAIEATAKRARVRRARRVQRALGRR